ncbi:TetR/AcrR family transcriptional regulator [Gordonia sp. ABSL49_1]|uniref:TetR/AcrR family transcriptional regulator n=1 Tax=unclassified Gordonia (in: high G+C Gram-positive bacteria) TaxID=2657482 RepID=UPI001F0FDBE6|nr:TetR family transcriptional regulator [Gordonia sp. ABSL49_1]MCH5642191.1 TetR family transcriptional regulator [Gordonia sp. ABSL49_1]
MSDEQTEAGGQGETRARLLCAAERLYAEHGISAVSNRQISKEAGLGNNYAVGIHFGSHVELIREILTVHNRRLDEYRSAALTSLGYISDLRDWLRCMVAPHVEYLYALGVPCHFARFCVQVTTDPTVSELVLHAGVVDSKPLAETVAGLYRVLPMMPTDVLDARSAFTRHLLLHSLADVERTLNDTAGSPLEVREQVDIFVDALVGIWLAPITSET